MAAIGMMGWLSVAATAVSAYGMYQQGQAQKKAGEYNSKVAQQNALIARQQADLKARQQDRLNRLRMGSIRANMGARGGKQNEGSVLDIIGDSAVQGELQRQEILYEGELKATGFEGNAVLDQMGADAAGKAGTISAGSSLLSGASSTGSMLKRG